MRFLWHDPRLLRRAEYLQKMQFLALVHYIDDLIRMVIRFPLHQGRQIRSSI